MSENSSNNTESNPFDLDQTIGDIDLVDDFTDNFTNEEFQDLEPEISVPHFHSEIKPKVKPVIVLPQRLTIWAIACAAIPSCIVAAFAYQINLQSLRDADRRTQELRATAIADSINTFVLNQYDNTKKLSQELAQTGISPLQSNQKFSDRQKQLITNQLNKKLKDPATVFSDIAIYSPQGNLILQASPNELDKTLDRAVLQKVTDFNSALVNQPVQVNNKYLIQFVAPIRDLKTQKIQAILTSQLPISAIRPNFTSGDYLISDANLKPIFFSRLRPKPESPNLDQASPVSVQIPSRKGLPDLKWNLTIGLEPIFENTSLIFVILGLILLLVGAIAIISYFAASQLSNRLIQAANSLRAIAEGKSEKPSSMQNNDEIGLILANLNLISVRFQNLQAHQELSSDHLQKLIAKGISDLQRIIQANGENPHSGNLEAISAQLEALLIKKQTQINLLQGEQERLNIQISQMESEVKTLQGQIAQQITQQNIQSSSQLSTIETLKLETTNSIAYYQGLLQEAAEQAQKQQVELTAKNDQIYTQQTDLEQVNTKIKDLANQIQALINQHQIQLDLSPNPDLIIEHIHHLQTAIALSTSKVNQLSAYSLQISRILELIHGIGIESNLISVNAGIKATHDQNHEFRVFSEQLSQIANTSASIMQELEDLAGNLQTETKEVIGSLELSTSLGSETSNMIAELKADLQSLEAQINLKSTAESQLYKALSMISSKLS